MNFARAIFVTSSIDFRELAANTAAFEPIPREVLAFPSCTIDVEDVFYRMLMSKSAHSDADAVAINIA